MLLRLELLLRPELLLRLELLLRPELLLLGRHASQLLRHAGIEGCEGCALGLGPTLLHGLEPKLNLRLLSDGLCSRGSRRTGGQGNGLAGVSGSLAGRGGGAQGESVSGQGPGRPGRRRRPGGGCGRPLGLGPGLEEDAVGRLGWRRSGSYRSGSGGRGSGGSRWCRRGARWGGARGGWSGGRSLLDQDRTGIREGESLELDLRPGGGSGSGTGSGVERGEGSRPGALWDWRRREGGPDGSGSGRAGGGPGSRGRRLAAGRSGGIAEPNLSRAAGDSLAQLGLEGAGRRVEDELAGEAGSDRGGGGGGCALSALGPLGRLLGERQGGLVEGERVQLAVKVESTAGWDGRSASAGSGSVGRSACSGSGSACSGRGAVGNGEQAVQGRLPPGVQARGLRSGAAVGDGGVADPAGIVDGRPDGLSLLGPGGVGNLVLRKLHGLRGPEPVTGVDGVLDLLDIFVDLSLLADLAGQAAHVGELPPLAVGVDVAVLAPRDAVDAPRLLAEGAILGDVAEGEAAVLVLVRIALRRLDRLRTGGGRAARAPLSLIFGARAGTALGNRWRNAGAAGGCGLGGAGLRPLRPLLTWGDGLLGLGNRSRFLKEGKMPR